jgi:hypothetical protein
VENNKILVKFKHLSPRFRPLYHKGNNAQLHLTGEDGRSAGLYTPQEKIVATLQI